MLFSTHLYIFVSGKARLKAVLRVCITAWKMLCGSQKIFVPWNKKLYVTLDWYIYACVGAAKPPVVAPYLQVDFSEVFAWCAGWFPARCREVRAFSSRDQGVAACRDHTVPVERLAFPCFYREAPATHLFTYSHLHVGVLQFLAACSRSDGTDGSSVTLFCTFGEKYLFWQLRQNDSAIVLSGHLFRRGGRREETNLPSKGMFFSFLPKESKKGASVFPKASFTHSGLWYSVSFQKE